MSDITLVSDLSIEFQKMKAKELREYSAAQYQTIESLKRENDVLREKAHHLEQMLSKKSAPIALPISDEEIICIEQINILKSKSNNRELSLDEVKRLDLLIKNLRLIREQSTQVIDTVDYSSMKEDDLVAALITTTETS